jgi:membrane-associated protein
LDWKAGRPGSVPPRGLLLFPQHLQRAHDFYEKYGGKTIVLARFVPIVRTFAPAVAGAANMNYRRFVTYNVAGGILWVWSMLLIGYSLSSVIPNIDQHIELVIVIVVFLSILPAVIEVLRNRRSKAAAP